jgi:hypothetical protein
VPLRTSKGSTFSRRTRGSCLGFKQEDGGVSSSLSCDFVILLGDCFCHPVAKLVAKLFRRKTTSQSTGAKHLDTQATTPGRKARGTAGVEGKESHRGARIARR